MGFLSKKLFGNSTKEMKKVEKVKLAVIFYSMGGTNFQLAKGLKKERKKPVLR